MMHRYILIGAVTFSLLATACSPSLPSSDEEQQPSDGQTSSAAMMENKSSTQAMMQKSESDNEKDVNDGMMKKEENAARTINVDASNWKFSPASITVKKGENISLKVTSTEGVHGFAIPALGINANLALGETVHLPLPTDTAGTYEFFCSVPCGAGHKEMRGTLVIE